MEDKRHPRIKDLPFEVPQNLDEDAFLFLGDPEGKTRTLIGRWWMAGGMTAMFTGSSILANVLARKPAIAALHRTVLAAVAGGFFGEWCNTQKEKYVAERDLQMFHYMCLHPEDFPKKERVLFRDYLTPWYPIR